MRPKVFYRIFRFFYSFLKNSIDFSIEKTIGENPIENYKQKSYRIFYRKFKVFFAKGTHTSGYNLRIRQMVLHFNN